ncbi:uncharacterized protein LOC129741699 isoform X1 [Uranotaenia lowii]|uniref:uncharacterized protein LOC129741699 isoform X1 n=1 Tax=Uranotaenia lowii TaxID=190385 RepID=UPI0024793988|nr:uncharacterized protein LOC129741699 isoform X1 [Uranotaenia lowii]
MSKMSKSPSSDTASESLSVSDESIAASVASSMKANSPTTSTSRSAGGKTAKKVPKEEPKERPPWRPASVTLKAGAAKKTDLRARILDMSRRLRRVNASVQTDPIHTKLMKEMSTDRPTDLIPMVDEAILTDGQVLVREVGKLIMSHSVAQMTDGVPVMEVATQTELPRSSVSFGKFLEVDSELQVNQPETTSFGELMQIDAKIKQMFPELDQKCEDGRDPSLDAPSVTNSPKEQNTPDLLAASSQEPTTHKGRLLEPPAFNAWQNLDFSDEECENYIGRELPRRSVGDIDRPWNDFKDLILGRRIANMRLSPIPPRKHRPNKKTVTWSDTQRRAVSELVEGATALMDMFDEVSLLLGPDIKFHVMPPEEDFKLPPPKWAPLLDKSCDLLEEKLAQVKHIEDVDFDKVQLKQPFSFIPPMGIDIEANL